MPCRSVVSVSDLGRGSMRVPQLAWAPQHGLVQHAAAYAAVSLGVASGLGWPEEGIARGRHRRDGGLVVQADERRRVVQEAVAVVPQACSYRQT